MVVVLDHLAKGGGGRIRRMRRRRRGWVSGIEKEWGRERGWMECCGNSMG